VIVAFQGVRCWHIAKPNSEILLLLLLTFRPSYIGKFAQTPFWTLLFSGSNLVWKPWILSHMSIMIFPCICRFSWSKLEKITKVCNTQCINQFVYTKVLTQLRCTFWKKNLKLNPQFENSTKRDLQPAQPQNIGMIKENSLFWSHLVAKHFEKTMIVSTCPDKIFTFSDVFAKYFQVF